ncbi:tautomerase family protein [Saccharopolyspora gloriosae]|uniref:tautomerase family protein n=1 Tax=Saccharopolyspora gloriosae TaxID=455344 RepID=UPI001FB7A2FB|nr:tautomerase family protein [Saccharopolyspora gloriosae]
MPMIQLTVPSGAVPEQENGDMQRALAAALLRWEGAPDTAFFRSLAWSYLTELPAGAQRTAEDELPRFRVEVTVPQGALSERRKAGLVSEVTTIVAEAAGLAAHDLQRVWVLVHEQPDGTWGVGGSIFRHEDLMALAKGERAGA